MIWANNDWSVFRSATASIPAPTSCTASAFPNRINITWSPVGEATSYNLYRAVAPEGPFVPIELMTTATAREDRRVPAGSTWYYRVTANQGGLESPMHSPTATASATQGLVARWSFDESGMDVLDGSGLGNHGQLIGAQRIPGRLGGAIRTSSQQFASVPFNVTPLFQGSAFTMTAWVRSTQMPAHERAMALVGSYHYYGIVNSTGRIGVHVGDADIMSRSSVIDGAWHHVAITRTGDAWRILIYGALQGEGRAPAGDDRPVNDLGRGQRFNGGDMSWMGDVDELRLYNVALDEAEIRAVMADMAPGLSEAR